mgnify:CR=1 FL=1
MNRKIELNPCCSTHNIGKFGHSKDEGGGKVKNFGPFSKMNIIFFSLIWLGYGFYGLFKNFEHKWAVFLFGAAFSAVLFLAVCYSEWLMKNYRKIERMRAEKMNKI